MLETMSLSMQAHSQSQRNRQSGSHEQHVDDRERGDDVDGAGPPERHNERADHLGPWTQQVDAGRVLAHEDHEHEQPAPEQAEPDERNRDVAGDASTRGSDDRGSLLELRLNLKESA